MKKLFVIFCISITTLLLCGAVQADAAQVYKDRSDVTFFNLSTYHTVDGLWQNGNHKAELINGTFYVAVEDFKKAFKVNISYDFNTHTVTMRHLDLTIKQKLSDNMLYVNGAGFENPAPQISSAPGHPVMIALEPFASTIGYSGKFEMTSGYAYGEMTMSLPKTLYTPTRVEVNQAAQLVTVYGKSDSGNVEPIRHMLCSTGTGTRTPNGTFKINPLGNDWYYFSSFNCYVRYCSQIYGNICFHSLTFNRMSNNSLSRTAYNAIGTKASHGCIRLFVDDAKFIHKNCRNLPVTITSGYTNDLTDSIRAQIFANKPTYEEYVKSLY